MGEITLYTGTWLIRCADSETGWVHVLNFNTIHEKRWGARSKLCYFSLEKDSYLSEPNDDTHRPLRGPTPLGLALL